MVRTNNFFFFPCQLLQVIDIPIQNINISSIAINFGIRKNKLKVKRGGNANSQPVINMNQLPKEISGQNPSINVARHPSLKAQRKEKELDKGQSQKVGDAEKRRRKVWVPPGAGGPQ